MLTITQMRRLMGVSRRTLQDYDEMGLLRHRDTTPGGYWLYAEEDAERLRVIQILHHFGYTRKEIRDVIDDPDMTFTQLLDRARTSLEQKRDRLNGILRQIGMIRMQQDMPAATQEAISRAPLRDQLSEPPLTEALEAFAAAAGRPDANEVGGKSLMAFVLLVYNLFMLQGEATDSPAVQDCVSHLYRLCSDDEDTADAFNDIVECIIEDPEFDATIGSDAASFIREAILHHRKSLPGAEAAGEAED